MIKVSNLKDWIIKDSIEVKDFRRQVDSVVLNLNQEKENISTHGDNSKQYFFDDFNKIKNISENIQTIILKHLKEISLELLSAWIHQHNPETTNHLSSVTFLDIPSNIDKNLSGDLFFILRNKNNELRYFRFQPKIGDLFFFPAHVFHGTFPQSEGNRQTINLDFNVKNII